MRSIICVDALNLRVLSSAVDDNFAGSAFFSMNLPLLEQKIIGVLS